MCLVCELIPALSLQWLQGTGGLPVARESYENIEFTVSNLRLMPDIKMLESSCSAHGEIRDQCLFSRRDTLSEGSDHW